MNTPILGRLEKVDLRTAWLREDFDFTPWLAQEENISLLGETIGIDLEVEAQERNVGPFRADILCKDLATENWVLIENQLEKTDHSHLGQLITYAAGLEAVTIVWIAARFTPEHRAALDWLNEMTGEEIRFFGLEVELWRIGDSPVAPKFNVISSPNSWSQNVKQAKKAIEEGDLSDLRKLQLQFWSEFLEHLQPHYRYARNATPKPQQWLGFPTGRSGQLIGAKIDLRKGLVSVSIECNGPHAKKYYKALESQKPEIEQDFGGRLVWDELPNSMRSRISDSKPETILESQVNWPECFGWLSDHLIRLDRAVRSRLQSIRFAGDDDLAQIDLDEEVNSL